MVMDPKAFLAGVNTFESTTAEFKQRVMEEAQKAQTRGDKTFGVATGNMPDAAWKAVQAEWEAAGWTVSHSNFRNEGLLSFTPEV